jgi:nucleoside phosphorylase
MWEELHPLRKHWNLDWTGPGDFFCGKWAGLRLQVALSGVGPRRARAASQLLLRHGKPDLLISLGYSGALKPDLQPGDCLLAHSIETPPGRIYHSPPLSSLEKHASWRQARLLSVSRLAPSAESKRLLAGQYPQAEAVDMESSALAEMAEQAQLPWRALRVIIDPLNSNLPINFDRCVNQLGQTAPVRLAREIAFHPHKIPALLQFSRWERKAREQLVDCSSTLLEVTSPW